MSYDELAALFVLYALDIRKAKLQEEREWQDVRAGRRSCANGQHPGQELSRLLEAFYAELGSIDDFDAADFENHFKRTGLDAIRRQAAEDLHQRAAN